MRVPVSLHALDLFQTRQGENFSFLVSHLSSFRGRRRRAFGQRFEFPWIEPDEVTAGADVEILDSLTGYNGNLGHPPSTGRTCLAGAVPAAGRVDFRHHLGGDLSRHYAGVVSLVFDGSLSRDEVVFLYSFVGHGVQFTHIAPEGIRDLEIQGLGVAPLVMFFTVSDGP